MVAVACTVIGVWLTTARSLWNYPFSFASVALYGIFFFRIKLYADMALQGIFALSLAYGAWQWLHGRSAQGEVLVRRLPRREIAPKLAVAILAAAAIGALLARYTDASLPWADSALLAGSLVGSFWAARRYMENWSIWIIVDTLYVALYAVKHAEATAVLYASFVAMAVVGWRRWRRAEDHQSATDPGTAGAGAPPAAGIVR